MILEGIYTYPIKSTRRLQHQHARVKPWGLEGDRRWMIVDHDAQFLTQREIPRLSLIQAVPQSGGNLLLSAEGNESIIARVPEKQAPQMMVSVWQDTVPAQIASNDINTWLTEFLNRPVFLVYMQDPTARLADPKYAKAGSVVSFADGYPLLCTTNASLMDLNQRLPEPISMERFRPNVVVTGDQPFGEDLWKRIRIGEVKFSVVKSCTRCVITTIDQDTAAQGKEPLRTLSTFRKRGGNVYFGENLVPENTGMIHMGDPVEILEFRSQRAQFTDGAIRGLTD